MYFKQMTLVILSLFISSSFLLAQDGSDTATVPYILETFNNDLNRQKQLEVLDHALGEEFDLVYELKLLMQDMTPRQKKYLLKFTYLKARKPMPIEVNDSLINYNIMSTFKNHLSRFQQLEVIEKSIGEPYNLEYELKLIMQNLDEVQKEDLLKFTFAKANKPLELKGKGPIAKIYWKEIEHNFGSIKKGKIISYTFDFKNIGKVPYDIESVEGSCGCTVASYTEGTIMPNQDGKVVVTFDSTNKPRGENTEFVTITGNTHPEKVVLLINIDVY